MSSGDAGQMSFPLKSFKGFISSSQSRRPLWSTEDHPSRPGEQSLGRPCHRIMHWAEEKREITSKEERACPPVSWKELSS